MKHASLDLAFVSDLLAEVNEDLRIFVGLEELSFPMMAIGACGLMNAAGNLNPRPLAEMCEAVWAGDLFQARRLHRQLWEINKAIFWDINPIPMKYMMKRIGILPVMNIGCRWCPRRRIWSGASTRCSSETDSWDAADHV